MSRSAETTREKPLVDHERIKAHLNLYAVLQNLEELVRLDERAAHLVREWNVSLQFTVRGGPSAYLEFADGHCTHGRGRRASADISLGFLTSRHLNAMFDGRAIPIPLRGLTRLGWLRTEFPQLTDRLVQYLQGDDGEDPAQDDLPQHIRITLLLQTGAFASAELAVLEPTSQQIAARMADDVLEIAVLPDGPTLHAKIGDGKIRVAKSAAEHPTARMVFRDAGTAAAILGGQLDSFRAVAEQRVTLAGRIAVIDDFSLILDRVEQFLG